MTRRAVVFLPNWIGDATMATPALRALREHWGGEAWIAGVMHPRVEPVLRGTRWLDASWIHDAAKSGRIGALGLARRLRAGRIDTSVHLTNDLRSVLVARLGGVRERAGYARNHRGGWLTTRLDPPRRGRTFLPIPAVEYYLALARALGARPASARLELAVVPEDEADADRAWAAMGLAPDARPVILNSSGASGPAKLWPEDRCAELAGRVARELGHDVVILCGPDERERAERIAARAGHPRVRALGGAPLSIGLSKAAVRRARCLVSTDSGPRHFGAAFGVPVVALFGPTDPAWTLTGHAGEVHQVAPAGMERIAVDDVFRAVVHSLAQAGAGASATSDAMASPFASSPAASGAEAR